MEVAWCADHGLPHSALLSWTPSDRAKLTAHLLESGSRCGSCGTFAWEWDADRYAYEAAVNHCPGCALKEAAAEDVGTVSGSTVVLVPRKVAAARRAAGQKG